MELIYAALLIHKAGGKITEETVTKVVQAAGGKPDQGKIKALIAALSNIDIEKAVKEAAIPVVAVAVPSGAHERAETKKEEKEEEKVDTEKAAAGLGALFG